MSLIHFTNEPLLSEFEAQATFNERRLTLAIAIKELIATSPLFKDKTGTAEFSHKGVSSLVAIITTEDCKFVLKAPLSLTDGNGEAWFLQEWEKIGVPVPHVFESGMLGNHPYLIMEYVEAPQLQQLLNKEPEKSLAAWEEIGSAMARMHTVKAHGFGRLVDGKPEHEHFEDWLYGPNIEKRLAYVREHQVMSDEHGNIKKAFEVLATHSKQAHSTLCHFDLTPNNVLATEPLTIFDPSPLLNLGVIDLGRSALSIVYHDRPECLTALLKGYYGDRPYDEQLVHASILLSAYWKAKYQHKTGKTEALNRAAEYLRARAHLL